MSLRVLAWVSLLLAIAAGCATAEDGVDFSRQILPLLSDRCFQCHGPDPKQRKAKLRLDEEDGAKADRDGDAAIVEGDSAASEVYRRIVSGDPETIMPPPEIERPLNRDQVNLIKRWIDEGAEWGQHWAFTRIERPALPATQREIGVIHNPIDAFVADGLAESGLTQSPQASRETLIRRLSLDLRGLPPGPDEVDDFVRDKSPGAYARLVDRYLAAAAFGERMAWDWLDAARYADSNGYQGDAERTMWPWRDWVVSAFNRNLPWDEFTLWQLAGDLLPESTREQRLATGFCRNHMINGEGGRIPAENRVDYVMDMTETMGTVWLALTLNCCRCHDHKFDPLLQREYYQLFAFFNQTPVDGGGGNAQTPPNIEVRSPDQERRIRTLDGRIGVLTETATRLEQKQFPSAEAYPSEVGEILGKPAAGRDSKQLGELEKHLAGKAPELVGVWKELRETRDQRQQVIRGVPRVMVMEDREKPRKTYIYTRGLYNKPGEEVSADVPQSLPALEGETPSNRLGLARWLMRRDHPLTARVAVNRFWQQLFGVGLVKTPGDFGVQGEFPKHPELLDWLAAEFMDSGWDAKHLLRTIVTSATYRQSSRMSPAMVGRDPENRFLARGPRFRLPSWMIRDQALAAAGLLVDRRGGAPVKPYQPPGVWADVTFGKKRYDQDSGEALYRRSLYTFWRRIIGPTMFFDSATRQTCTVKVARTNTPLQALGTLNDVTYVEAARAMAQRALGELPDSTPSARMGYAFRLVMVRGPNAEEGRILAASLERFRKAFAANPEEAKAYLGNGESLPDAALDPVGHAALAAVCLGILNLDEALNKE